MSKSEYLDVKSTVGCDSGIGNLVSQPIGSVQLGVGYAVFEVLLHLSPPLSGFDYFSSGNVPLIPNMIICVIEFKNGCTYAQPLTG